MLKPTKINRAGVAGEVITNIASSVIYSESGIPIAMIAGIIVNGNGQISMFPIIYNGDKQYLAPESLFDIADIAKHVRCISDEIESSSSSSESMAKFYVGCGDRYVRLTYCGSNWQQLTTTVSRIVDDNLYVSSTVIYECKNGVIKVIKESNAGDYYTDYLIDPAKVAVEIERIES